jgi:hypothetical protein
MAFYDIPAVVAQMNGPSSSKSTTATSIAPTTNSNKAGTSNTFSYDRSRIEPPVNQPNPPTVTSSSEKRNQIESEIKRYVSRHFIGLSRF